jgi:hypothetical protein
MDSPAAGAVAAAAVEERRGVAVTEYRIAGDLQPVLQAIAKLFSDYHPMGYGTRVHSVALEGMQYQARVSRANSCD